MLAIEADAGTQRIVMIPNRAMSVAGLRWFFAGISLVTLALAAWFTSRGFWPVLVYAILELSWLGGCLRLCWLRGGRAEEIVVTADTVIVDRAGRRRHEHAEFSRYWARLVMKEPDARLHPRRLLIRSHGRECEVGRCLTENERDRLAQRLGGLIGPMTAGRMTAE
ncbi:MAG TPA: DUF2244 domain-containing protein [Gammaproteobacteria bacterium]|nr:DUF2244 domain-containing protein [Gammaproteobacteria bacterium]